MANPNGNRNSIHIPVEHGEKTYQLAKYPPFLLISVFALPQGTGSTYYTVRDVIDDGTGMTTLMLEAD